MPQREVKYFSFKRARSIVRGLKLGFPQDFFELRKKRKLPRGVPPFPNNEYLYEGWQDWDDFLGKPPRVVRRLGPRTGRAKVPAMPKVKPLPFRKMRKYARSLKLESARAWFEHCRAGHLPPGVTVRPGSTYPQEWDGWVDFLGLTLWDRKLKKYN